MIEGKQTVVKSGEAVTAEGYSLHRRKALVVGHQWLICARCGEQTRKQKGQLPAGFYYCPACVSYGRLTDLDELVTYYEENPTPPLTEVACCQWKGQLTKQQQQLAQALQEAFINGQNVLLWAVTGSGKTEMLFPVIADALKAGLKVAVATPRIDVCRELFPRLVAAFPLAETLLRYGKAEESWRGFRLLVCTTHQLLHFYRGFSLLIIDESDAFPYEGNRQLAFATQQAVKTSGVSIYLTATPTMALLAKAKAENWQILQLPQRYHQRPLILPQCRFWEGWRLLPERPRQLLRFRKLCEKLLQNNRLLVFCPNIAYMHSLAQALKAVMPSRKIAAVSAQDATREEKVQKMREGHWDLLLTSTVLERGVTFADVSVIVIGAEHAVFTKSVLVQIAGRVDRKGAFNHGQVWFLFQEQTTSIRRALKEIRHLNRLAARMAVKK